MALTTLIILYLLHNVGTELGMLPKLMCSPLGPRAARIIYFTQDFMLCIFL